MAARPIAGLLAQRLVALFIAGWLLFDFPLLKLALGSSVAGEPVVLFGLPRLPLLLFVAWALLIALLAGLMERGGESADGDGDASRDDVATPGDEPGLHRPHAPTTTR
jgi:hypothetical protein